MIGKVTAAVLVLSLLAMPVSGQDENRVRSRDAGIITGTLKPGELNMITDVAGVKVWRGATATVPGPFPWPGCLSFWRGTV